MFGEDTGEDGIGLSESSIAFPDELEMQTLRFAFPPHIRKVAISPPSSPSASCLICHLRRFWQERVRRIPFVRRATPAPTSGRRDRSANRFWAHHSRLKYQYYLHREENPHETQAYPMALGDSDRNSSRLLHTYVPKCFLSSLNPIAMLSMIPV